MCGNAKRTVRFGNEVLGPPVPYPEPPFDSRLVELSLRKNPHVHKIVQDAAVCAIRVRDLEDLLTTIQPDMAAYCHAHTVDEGFRHVCQHDPCPFDHTGVPHVDAKSANGPQKALSPNMHLVVGRYVKPWTRKHKVSYAGALIAIQAARTRSANLDMRASAFISHNWEELFEDFVATALNALHRDDLVWVCSFLIDQNADIGKTLGTDLREVPFARALRRADRVINFMDSKAATLTRSWVVFETYLTLTDPRDIKFHVALPNNSDRDAWDAVCQQLQCLDVRRCQASKQSDHEMIMKLVSGNEDSLNDAVKAIIGRACVHAGALEAARVGNLAALKNHPEPLCLDAGFTTTLHFAAEAQSEETLVYLIESRADVSAKNKDGDVALHYAACTGRVGNLTMLLQASADICAKNNEGSTALHVAVQNGQNDMAAKLIELGSSVTAVDEEGMTPLHCSTTRGDVTLATTLAKFGALVNAQTHIGRTPLHLAALNGQKLMVSNLISLKALVDAQDSNGETALHCAACSGHTITAETLVELSAGIDTKTKRGWSPLHWATYEGFAATANRLLELGALVDAKTSSGRAALQLAASSGHAAVATVLFKHGAAIDSEDAHGNTALHWAAVNGHTRTVNQLVQLGIPIDAKDHLGKTALHTAAAKGWTETVTSLISLGALLDVIDATGKTPYQEALQCGHAETAEQLRGLQEDDEEFSPASSAAISRSCTMQTEMVARLNRAARKEQAEARCSVM